jgi:protein-L-isoaspartate(D-aspartate) O-methyltransferase
MLCLRSRAGKFSRQAATGLQLPALLSSGISLMSMNLEQARFAMIEQQVRPWDVLDPRVLAALMAVHREEFVPDSHRQLAFVDLPLPLAHGEVMMKPVVEGRMLQALNLEPGDEVLEIGTGSGFITACLSRLARGVVSIDRHADFTAQVGQRLGAMGVTNVRLETADALSWQPGRQFDAIAVTAAVVEIPEMFIQWLKPGGRLFAIRGHSPVQEAVRATRRGETLHFDSLFETDVPYLHGAEPVPRFTL